VVIGEGETLWPRLIGDFRRGRVQPFYRNDAPVDIDQSPTPRYDLVDPRVFPVIPMQTSRGCPWDCSFCTATRVYGPRYRHKSIPKVVREIEAIQQIALSRRVVFNDDNTFVNRTESYKLLEALVPLKLRYFTEADVSIAEDDQLLDLMAGSGCVTVFIGFESLVQENLDSLQDNRWKGRRLGAYSEACRKIQSHGIQVLGAFILGFDHDTPAVFDTLIDFVLGNNILGQFPLLTPFPGTRIREGLIREGRLPADDDRWDLYGCFDVVVAPKLMSQAQLEEGSLRVHESVYTKEAHRRRSRHMIEMLKHRASGEPAPAD
jgi:radical SAM superfamily enzyme YgiQ (UPF0313 family)